MATYVKLVCYFLASLNFFRFKATFIAAFHFLFFWGGRAGGCPNVVFWEGGGMEGGEEGGGGEKGLFFQRSGPKVACRCSFLPWSGRWVGAVVCVASRRVRVTGPLAICRVQSGALVCRRHGHGAAPCASGGGSSISCTMVHRACAVQCASAVQAVTPADAWWTHAFPRTCLGGAHPQSGFYTPTFWCTSNLLW